MNYDTDSCFKCGANAWTTCEHRVAVREKPKFVDVPDKIEIFRKASGGGRFSRARHVR